MPSIGGPELLIILAIVVMIFGVGKLAGLGGAVGRTIREFRKEVGQEEKPPQAESHSEPPPAKQSPPPGKVQH